MIKCNSIETLNKYLDLSDQTKFRLNEINEYKGYFNSEIQERKIMSKILSKYIAAFDYIDKTLIVLSTTRGGISIISFASVIGVPVEIASASFTLVFPLTTRILKKLLSITRNKKKKHPKIVILAKSKLSSIETLISQSLMDLEISHEEFKTIVNEKEKYEKIKEDIRLMKISDELDKEEGIKIKTTELWVKTMKMHRIKIFFFLNKYKCTKLVLKNMLMPQ